MSDFEQHCVNGLCKLVKDMVWDGRMALTYARYDYQVLKYHGGK